jgi:hypothetical protein
MTRRLIVQRFGAAQSMQGGASLASLGRATQMQVWTS